MIRINLLGVPKGKTRRSSDMAGEPTGAGRFWLKLVAVALLFASGSYLYWSRLDQEQVRVAIAQHLADGKNRELAEVKSRYLERQRQAEALRRRVEVIRQLRANQAGPATLLSLVGQTVNNSEAVWLSNLKDLGPVVNIEGIALSTTAVAGLMSNLKQTGYFKTVEIKESIQDEQVKDMQAFQFTLVCEKSKG